MGAALARLAEHSRRLLAAACDETDDAALFDLLAARAALLPSLASALAAGESAGDDEIAEIGALEAGIRDALVRRRDAIGRELQELRRGRAAASAYRTESAPAARYVDREG